MSGHTPGNWKVRRSTFAGEIRGDNARGEPFIAQCVATDGNYIEAEANARIIAAAPDLLAVLIEIRDDKLAAIAPGTFERIDAAIAKATGTP